MYILFDIWMKLHVSKRVTPVSRDPYFRAKSIGKSLLNTCLQIQCRGVNIWSVLPMGSVFIITVC